MKRNDNIVEDIHSGILIRSSKWIELSDIYTFPIYCNDCLKL